MAEEKEQSKLEDTASDHIAAKEIGDGIDEKRLLRKLDWHLVPGPALLLLLSFVDRINGDAPSLFDVLFVNICSVGNAVIEGLLADLHMSRLRCAICVADTDRSV